VDSIWLQLEAGRGVAIDSQPVPNSTILCFTGPRQADKPKKLNTYPTLGECSDLNFDSKGKIDTTYIKKGSRMLFGGIEPFPDEESQPEVIDARHRIVRTRYENEYLWKPTQEIMTEIMEAIFGKD
jgi:hypothetical protein